MTQESEIKLPTKFQNSDMLKSLESLVDETLQIYEFNTEEEGTIEEICDTIGMMLAQLRTSISISPNLLGPNDIIRKAVLGQNGQLMVTYRDDEVEYKRLTDYRASMLMDILNDIFPKLKHAATDYKKTLEERLSLYRAANKKMKKIDRIFKETQKSSIDDVMQDDPNNKPNV